MNKAIITLLFILFSIPLFSQIYNQINGGLGLDSYGLPLYLSYEIPAYYDIAMAPQIQYNLMDFDYIIFGIK